MYKKTCKCGKTSKNFKFDIGEFFIAKCCLDAGYDKLGNMVEKEEKSKQDEPMAPNAEAQKQEKLKVAATKAKKATTKKKKATTKKKKASTSKK